MQKTIETFMGLFDPKMWTWHDLGLRFSFPDLYRLRKVISELVDVPDGTCLSPDGKFHVDWKLLGGEAEIFAEEFPQLELRGDLLSYVAYRGISGLKLHPIGGNRVVPIYGPYNLIQAASEAFGINMKDAADLFLPSSYGPILGPPMSRTAVLKKLNKLIDNRLGEA